MKAGDLVYIWRSGGSKRKESGIIASALITDPPSVQPEDPRAIPYWEENSKSEAKGPKLRVRLGLERIATPREMIDRNWLLNDPILFDLPILKMAQNTNYLVSNSHQQRLKMLWDRTGVDWTRDESMVGLWTYAQLIGKPVSETKDSLVAKSAVMIGRAVSGMYSKVQNFLSLDPRDERKGLDGAGAMDRQVWSEFFDTKNNEIRLSALESEVLEKWGGIIDPEKALKLENPNFKELIATQADSPNFTNDSNRKSKPRGQGLIRDAFVKKAIELRAVTLATEYYQELGFEVIDRGATESFDLSCVKESKERRAEVKGTTSDGVSVFLTRNEVEHARSGSFPVDLIVVSKIEVLHSPEGPQAFGGRVLVIKNWVPNSDDLTPMTYSYRVKE